MTSTGWWTTDTLPLSITGWWAEIRVAFALSVPPSLGDNAAAVAVGAFGVSVAPTLAFTAAPKVAAAFTLSVPPSLSEATGAFPFPFPHTFG